MRRWMLAVLLLAGCFGKKPPPAAPSASTTPEAAVPITESERLGSAAVPVHTAVNDAVALLEVGREAEARRARDLLLGVVKAEPDNGLAWVNLGIAHHQLGDLPKAQRAYEKAVAVQPDLGDAWLYSGILYSEQGRADSALASYQTGALRDPRNPRLQAALVGALRQQGRFDEAEAAAKAALRVNSNAVAVFNELGLVYLQQERYDLAKFVFQKAMASVDGADQDATLNANLGWTYFQSGRPADARHYLQESLRLDPHMVPAQVYLSRLYLDDHNYVDTVPLLEGAFAQQPDDHGVVMNLGIAYRGVGRLEDAEAMYLRALELAPSDPSPWFNLGVLYGDHMKDYDRGISAFESYIAKGGTDREQARAYADDLVKERERAEKKRQAEEERAAREAERAERERLLREAEQSETSKQPEPAGGSPWGGNP